jgi:protein-tyrosine phosphatase
MNKRPADYIYKGLWVGPIEEVSESDREYDNIVSVCQDVCRENVSDNVPYHHIPLADDAQSEIEWGGSCSYGTFSRGVETLRDVHTPKMGKAGPDTLLHCHHGKNRSVAVAAAYIACDTPILTVDGAIKLIEDHRPIADPNSVMRNHAYQYVHNNADYNV